MAGKRWAHLPNYEQRKAALVAARNAVRPPLEERFAAKIVKAEGHWLWIGAHKPSGYGMFFFDGNENFIAHRASYIMHKGPIADDLDVDHTCGVKSCVNPDHLRAVSERVNALENNTSPMARNSKKTHCKHGHPYTETNTALYSRKGGVTAKGRRYGKSTARVCLICYPHFWRYAVIPRNPPPNAVLR